jgi:hypothetical protein
MTTPTLPKWIERLQQLHPLLKAPPPVSDWAARQAEIDAASKVDAEAACGSRDKVARRKEREYDNDATTWAGVAIVVVIVIVGLFVPMKPDRLGSNTKLMEHVLI